MQKRSLYFILFLIIGVMIGAFVSPLIFNRGPNDVEHIASLEVISPSGSAASNRMASDGGMPSASADSNSGTDSNERAIAVPVRAEPASKRDLSLRLDLQGTLTPKLDVSVVPKVSGRVERVLVDVGDHVQAGEPLLVLEDNELLLAEQQALAAVSLAESQLARTQLGARPQEIELVEAQLAQATAHFEQAESNYERMSSLYESRSISKAQLEQSRAQYDVALASLKAAETQLELTKLGATKQDLQAAEAQLAQAQTGLQLARLQLENARLTSPVSGTIAGRMIDPGGFAGAGVPVFQIVQVDPIILRGEVSGREVVHVKPGLPALLHTDAYPGRSFPGAVSIVENVAHAGSRLFGVRVEVPNEDGLLRAGMASRVQIVIDEAIDTIAIPEHALLHDIDGTIGVFVASDGIAHRKEVSVGLITDGWAEITEGIDPGELVIVSGYQFLTDGDPVNVIESGTTGRSTR